MPHPAVTGARRSQVFWTATGLIALDTILFTMVVPALPEFAERDGFGTTVAALIFAAFPVAQLISALIAAGLVERIGRRPVTIAAVVLLLLATLAFAGAHGAPSLAGARAAQGAAAGLVWTAGMACIADIYPRDQLGLRMGLAETAGGATGLLGPVLGGLLISVFGVEEAFLFIAIVPALAIIPALFMPETRHVDAQPPPPLTRSLAILMRVRRAWVAAVSLGLFAAALALLEPLLPLDLADRLGLGSLAVGLIFGAGLAAYYLAMPFAGRWSDRRGRRAPLMAGALIMAGSLPFIAIGSAWAVAAAFAITGVGMACVSAPSGPLMVEAVDETELAGNYGVSGAVLTALFAIGYTVGPLLGAAASLALPFPVTMMLTAALALVVGVWGARMLPPHT